MSSASLGKWNEALLPAKAAAKAKAKEEKRLIFICKRSVLLLLLRQWMDKACSHRQVASTIRQCQQLGDRGFAYQ